MYICLPFHFSIWLGGSKTIQCKGYSWQITDKIMTKSEWHGISVRQEPPIKEKTRKSENEKINLKEISDSSF